ncbi:MAG: replication factor C large subunit [Candidatus Methanoperedens sp.]|nr:replication factor C large subunit [Candidatus Methanoperedens sp.]
MNYQHQEPNLNVAGSRINRSELQWTEKYRPQTLSAVAGHNKALEDLKIWAKSWMHGIPQNRAVVLYGRAGTGKTTTAHALARDMAWEVIELNASDQRTADIIDKVAGSASRLGTLEGSGIKRLIIMDEADNIHGTADRGGERAIAEIIKNTGQPIILIANELYDMSTGLRTACKPIQFNSVMSRSMIPVLKKIVESEGIKCDPGVIEKIAVNANGDLRSAINDLQAIAQGKTSIQIADIITGERDSKENIFKFLTKIFKSTHIREAHDASLNLDENPDDLIQWMDENLSLEYTAPTDLAKGYHYLGRASVFLGRVKRRQNYNMWRYAGVLMTAGIIVARSHRSSGFVKYQPPSLWRKLGQTKGMRLVRDSTAKKIGMHCHVSMNYTRSQLFVFFRSLMKDHEIAPKVVALLGLQPEEIAFLMESKSVTKKILKIYETARCLVENEIDHEVELFGGFVTRDQKIPIPEPEKIEPEISSKKDSKAQSSLFDF